MSCPICAKPSHPDYRPFCSRRCANVDLGRWLDERYRVPAEPVTDDAGDDPDDMPRALH